MAINPVSSSITSYLPSSDAYITEAKSQYEQDANKTDSFIRALESAQKQESDEEIMEACVEFESYFIQMMFKEMRKTVVQNDDGFFKKSNAELTFQDMLDEEVSVKSAESGGIGLAQFMYRQMKREGYGTNLQAMLQESGGDAALASDEVWRQNIN